MGIKSKSSDSAYTHAPIPDASRETPISETDLLARTPNVGRLDRVNRALYVAAIVLTAIVGIGSVLLVLASSQTFYAQGNSRAVKPNDTNVPTATPTVVSNASVSIEILNGSGVAGAAAAMAAKLEAQGYTVVRIGNAPKQSGSTLSVRPSSGNILATLQADISSVTRVASADATLTDSTASARVVIGSN